MIYYIKHYIEILYVILFKPGGVRDDYRKLGERNMKYAKKGGICFHVIMCYIGIYFINQHQSL